MTKMVRASVSAWLLALFFSMFAGAQTLPCTSSVSYGNNAAAGHFATVNGIHLYYETYGRGPVLLLMHGNGGSIARMACQIAFFSSSHKVVAVDSRGRGKSEDGKGPFTFEQQADDFSSLLEQSISTKPMLSDKATVALSRW